MKLYILAKIQQDWGLGNTPSKLIEKDLILDTFYNVKAQGGKLDKEEEIESLQGGLTIEYVQKLLQDQDTKGIVLSFKVVAKPRVRWIQGMYHAAEYDKYVLGQARLIKWTDDYWELEVECLDKNLQVGDGIWEYQKTHSGNQDNGCGDSFMPSKRLN